MSFNYASRRERIARALALTDEVVLIGAGVPVPKPEISDALLPFIAHQEYLYLAGHAEAAGGILAYDPKGGPAHGWVSFVPEVSEMDRVWEGKDQLPGALLSEFPAWLAARQGRRLANLGALIDGIAADAALTLSVRGRYRHARAPKEPEEIAVMQRCAVATAAGYARIQPMIRPGVSERALQIEMEAEYFRHGAQTTGYDTIIGAGAQSAVFHGNPSPTRYAQDGDFILIDAGAQLDRYVIDVTRTYVAGKPSAFQRDLHQAVLEAQIKACDRCRPGTEWKDIHFTAAIEMLGSLKTMGVVKSDPAALVERDGHMLFYPHGIGHMVGLGVRDASGLEPGRTKDPRPCLRSLRMDLILRPGHIVTIEPGLYFIPAILNDPARRAQYRDDVNWDLVDEQLRAGAGGVSIGGVRIEDNMLVTEGAPVNLTTAIPKQW